MTYMRLFKGLLVAGVVGLTAGLALAVSQFDLSFLNPFTEQRTDRSQPPLLESVQDIERFDAVEGTFQVVIDLEDNRRFVPDFLLNQRTLFVAVGSVDSYVDFTGLDEGALTISGPEERSVRISLPPPRLDEAALDLEASYVVSDERGLLNRVGDAFSEQDDEREREVYALAAERLDEAAVEADLLDRAEDNTRQFLTGLVGGLGYTDVTVDFDADSTT